MNKKMMFKRMVSVTVLPIKRRFRDRRGFSLAETLLAVLILMLVSVIVATGMPAATNAYNKVILGANAKVMLSTAITALHDELGTAWRIVPSPDNKSLTYFNASTGAKSRISLDTGKYDAIQIEDYISLSDDFIHGSGAKTGAAYHLVSDSQSSLPQTSRMSVTYSTIQYNSGIITITGLKVCKQDNNKTMLVQYSGEDGNPKPFTIRIISNDLVKMD